MDELLTDVSPELVDEFSSDFFANRGRKVLHDSRRWRVLDTWIGDPPQYYRQAVDLDLCSWGKRGGMGGGGGTSCHLAHLQSMACPKLITNQ